MVISGDSKFDGTWEIKQWKPEQGFFDLVVPEAEVVEAATPVETKVETTQKDGVQWAKDTQFHSVPQAGHGWPGTVGCAWEAALGASSSMLSEPNSATIIALPTMFINMPNNAKPKNIVHAATILPGTVTGYMSP